MKKIVVIIQPFDLLQKFFILEDGDVIKTDASIFNQHNIFETLVRLSEENDVDQVDLSGPKAYTVGIKQYCEEALIKNYDLNKFTINII